MTRESGAHETPRERTEPSDDAVVTPRDEPSALERGARILERLSRPKPR